MTLGSNHIDRLLPRHHTGDAGASTGLEFAWNVHLARRGVFKKEETHSRAVIHDLSLEGALVEVPDSQEHEVGTIIDVRFDGIDGRAEICHRRTGPDGHLLYGVKFRPQNGFGDAINIAVGEMRGQNSALRAAWQRQN